LEPRQEKSAEGEAKEYVDSPPETGRRWRHGLPLLLVLALGWALYMGAISVPFHGEGLTLFTGGAADFPHAPLTAFGFSLEVARDAQDSATPHAVNLLLHLANAVLAYFLTLALLGSRRFDVAVAAALALCLHPFAQANVFYLMGRPGLQATFFSLLSFLLFLKTMEEDKPRHGFWGAAMLCYVLAVGSHMAALGLPAAFLVADALCHGGGGVAQRRGAHGAFWAALGLMLAAYVAASGATGLGTVPLACRDLLFTGSAYALYWPGLRPLAGQFSGEGYLVGVAFLLALCWILAGIRKNALRYAVLAVICLWVGGAGFWAVQQNPWNDPVALWTTQAERHPDTEIDCRRYIGRYALAYGVNLSGEAGKALLSQGEAAWRKVVEKPRAANAEDWVALGQILHYQGRFSESHECFEEALRYNPYHGTASWMAGMALLAETSGGAQGDRAWRAVEHFQRAERQAPLPLEAQAAYGAALAMLGSVREAGAVLAPLESYREQAGLDGLFASLQSQSQAIRKWREEEQKLMAQQTGALQSLYPRAERYLLEGEYNMAAYSLWILLSQMPEHKESWVALGFCQAKMNDAQSFSRTWTTPPQGDRALWKSLAARCQTAGMEEAARLYAARQSANGST
jgi:tetratricopeptide (TPR) repeat protein